MTVQNDRIIGIGQDLGPYRIEALLGTGGMGIVYRARHLQLKRTVAIKMVDRRRSKADSGRWLLQEARLAAALNHPCICNVHDIGYVGDQPFIVMEHVEGTLLSALIPAGQGFPAGTTMHYALQIVDAVAHAHGRGIVHRDLKSSNIIVELGRTP
jgi:serine/threonine-protein kinase